MMKYYVVVNDMIGGWDVSLQDKPASEHSILEAPAIAWGLSYDNAHMIADALMPNYEMAGRAIEKHLPEEVKPYAERIATDAINVALRLHEDTP